MTTLKKILITLTTSFLTLTSISQSQRWGLNESIWSRSHHLPANKPLLDFDAIDSWTSLPFHEKISISRDGQYFVYGIQNNLKNRLDSVIVQSTINNWQVVLAPGAQKGFFSLHSQYYVFQDKTGICFIRTGTSERRYEKGVESYTTDSKNEWLAYRLSNNKDSLVLLNMITGIEHRLGEMYSWSFDETDAWFAYLRRDKYLVLRNLISGKENTFSDVRAYNFHVSGKWLEYQKEGPTYDLVLHNLKNSSTQRFLNVKSYKINATGDYILLNGNNGLDYVNLVNEKKTNMWFTTDTSIVLKSFAFDKESKQVLFITENGSDKAIWYWKAGMERAVMKVNWQTDAIGKDLFIQGTPSFTDNGRYVRFILQSVINKPGKVSANSVQLDVWSYQDRIMQNDQSGLSETKTYSAILNLATGKVIQPEREYERLGMVNGDYALIHKSGKDVYANRFWENGFYNDSTWLISLQNGHRRLIPTKSSYNNIWFSPDSKYLVYFDAAKQCNYFSYELVTGKLRNISTSVADWQLGMKKFNLRTSEKPASGSGIKLWLEGDKGFLVYDNYRDIWQLDPSGKKPAVNITNGYGHEHNISFTLLTLLHKEEGSETFIGKDTLLLSAFNTKTKLQGFYRKVLGLKGYPELLSMEPAYMMSLRDGINGQYPIKASDANTWIVNRQSTIEAPNYYATNDFITFQQLTFIQPQKKYNWVTSELHTFKQLDGTASQGVLYKPENFNPKSKYPLIISFYGDESYRLNHYPMANYIDAPIIDDNPAWMVSHGYLVFIPDIYFTKGQWGPSTVNTVNGAAEYLRTLPFVEGQHLGAVGHSNSGRFGYYLFTHSNQFAAMSVGSGTTNVMSFALAKELEQFEILAYGTGLGNPWQNKNSWLDHTSVLSADKIISPLLQFHCKKDAVPFEQAIQLFTALRRLEKKAWMLQYDKGGHRIDGDDARDWTIRYTQFFDHYLKQSPAPGWMTQGIPYKLKGIEARYELDAAGSCAMQGKNHCYICEAWNKQHKRDTAMFSKEIKYWELDSDIKTELDKKTTAERKRLDKEQAIENKRIVNILKYGYPEDEKRKREKH